MHTVIAYDVADNQRRQRVVRALEDVGDRVQYSVFEAVLTPRQLADVRKRLAAAIEPTVDSIRFYPLCEACRRRVQFLGPARTVGGEEVFIV